MIGSGSVQVYAARVQPVMERISARRLEHAASQTAKAPRREGAAQTVQSQEAIQSQKSALAAAAHSFTKQKAVSGRLVEQNLSGAGRTRSDGVAKEGAAAAQTVNDAKASEGSRPASPTELSSEEKAAVNALKARDSEVRNHERAHKAAGGQHAGAISFTYQSGPDGRQYAVGGEVPIDVSPEQSPEATIQKMNIVISAALAPAEPSGQDQAVARAAQAQRNQALAELNAQKAAERKTLRTDSSETPESQGAPIASAAVSAQENIYDLLRAAIDGAPENRLFRTA